MQIGEHRKLQINLGNRNGAGERHFKCSVTRAGSIRGRRRERVSRGVPTGLAMLAPLTFNMALAALPGWASATFGGRIWAKQPSNLSIVGVLDSPRPKNFQLLLRIIGRNFCFWTLYDSPMRTITSCRSNASDGGSVTSIFSPGEAVFFQASSAMTHAVAAWEMHTSRAVSAKAPFSLASTNEAGTNVSGLSVPIT
jgi:hypothetical protein